MTLEQLVGEVLDVDPTALDDDSSPASVDGWDSLAHVALVTAVEEAYSVTLTTDEMRESQSLGTLRQVLLSKGASV